MNDAIAAHRLPGAVVVIGHGDKVVFHQAYGSRKLAGEPGLDGSPAPAEPMTEDTIFDLASLTKCLATATAVMQLYEQGKLRFDDPVQTYLPDFNTANDPQRATVTVRMLLTHTSGEATDVSLKDPWGLDGADKSEGIHRALTTPLQSGPGEVFRYSDINYILLGALIEKVTNRIHPNTSGGPPEGLGRGNRNLTGVLEATVRDPARSGPGAKLRDAANKPIVSSASTGDPTPFSRLHGVCKRHIKLRADREIAGFGDLSAVSTAKAS
jgi:hypothetical protein